jgi:hypothetical protein
MCLLGVCWLSIPSGRTSAIVPRLSKTFDGIRPRFDAFNVRAASVFRCDGREGIFAIERTWKTKCWELRLQTVIGVSWMREFYQDVPRL